MPDGAVGNLRFPDNHLPLRLPWSDMLAPKEHPLIMLGNEDISGIPEMPYISKDNLFLDGKLLLKGLSERNGCEKKGLHELF